jgi:ABC-type transport system substrate-binding protein
MGTIVGVLAGADPSLYFSGYAIGAVNFSKGGDPAMIAKVQSLVDQADDPTQPQAKRGDLYQQAHYIVADQAWAVQVCNGKQTWIYQPKVAGVDDTWIGALGALPWFGNLALKKS